MTASEGPHRARANLRLSTLLLLALLAFGIVLALVLVGFIGPRAEDAFRRHGAELIEEGAAAMREVAAQQTGTAGRVLVDLIEHGTQTRRKRLADQPLELFGGDVEAIRDAIREDDRLRSLQQQQNVAVLAREMQARTERRIDARFEELSRLQAERTEAAAAELRVTHLVLVGTALGLLLIVFGFGLDRLVVRPTRALRAATRRVAEGHLDTDLPAPSGHELGELTRDFGVMVDELRGSRRELQRLNENLEQEVARKTAHLERALEQLKTTHRKLAETERFAALGTLAGGISHEFHNVIGGIRGCTDELLAGEEDEDRQETMQVILRAADRASGIVQQLLRFARRSVERREDVDPQALVEDALRLCEPAAKRQGVAVERALTAGPVVPGDPDALHQVVTNLLLNALQAMPNGGELRVGVCAREDGVAIEVTDTGVGISEEDLEHVFEPFFTRRADPDAGGTGLGLSVSYGIVQAHGGTIAVTSTPGAGSTFTVCLPAEGA